MRPHVTGSPALTNAAPSAPTSPISSFGWASRAASTLSVAALSRIARGQRILGRSTRGAQREQFAVLERGNLQRGQATEKLARRPHLVRNAPRAGVVQATDESPQAVAER